MHRMKQADDFAAFNATTYLEFERILWLTPVDCLFICLPAAKVARESTIQLNTVLASL